MTTIDAGQDTGSVNADADEISQEKKPKRASKAKSLTKGLLDTGMLAFERSLQVSEALMFGARTNDKGDRVKTPVIVVEKGVRGATGSYFASEADRKKKAGNANIQTVEAAYLPVGCDELLIEFMVRVLPGSVRPSACDDRAVAAKYQELSAIYAARSGYETLAARYVWNILNGRVAWRNAFQTDSARVHIRWGELSDQQVEVRVLDEIRRDRPRSMEEIGHLPNIGVGVDGQTVKERLKDLVDAFQRALSGERPPLNVRVTWSGEMSAGQEVFPSQEYLRDSKKKADGALSRVLAKIVNGGLSQASIHSQKIGAAIAHIDDWHPEADEIGVIVPHPYGAIYGANTGVRLIDSLYEKRADFERLIAPENQDDLHFVMANLVRGGVLGKAAKGEADD